jgi:hypothetical protein
VDQKRAGRDPVTISRVAEDTGALMVKKIGPHDWPDGVVDLLGHLF